MLATKKRTIIMTTMSEEILIRKNNKEIKELQALMLLVLDKLNIDDEVTFSPKPVKTVVEEAPTKVRTVKDDKGNTVKQKVKLVDGEEEVVEEKMVKKAPVMKNTTKKPMKGKINV